MSRFQKLSHVIWHCQYHIVWVPKYRYKVLKGKIGEEVRKTIIVQSERLGCEIVELNVQVDHVHLLIKVPPKVSISALMGVMKGKSAIRRFPAKRYTQLAGLFVHFLRCQKGYIARYAPLFTP